MDDLDKFLEEAAATVPPPGTAGSTMSTEKDDDFLAFLDAPVTITPGVKGSGLTSVTTLPLDDTADFLEWLQDSPRTQKKTLPSQTVSDTSERQWDPNASFMETEQHLHRQNADTSKESMDSFFNDVFGTPSHSTKSRALVGIDESEGLSPEEGVQEIVESSFPDIPQLRKVISEAGYVPVQWRAQVWSLLLNESCVEDEEVRHYSSQSSVNEMEALQTLVSDCAAVMASSGLLTGTPTTEAARRDMQDILALYCQRRNVQYSPVLCRLLSPLLAVPERASRTLASSCFYTVASTFVPLLNLPVSMDASSFL
jgi:hypothetical protein